MIGHVQKPLKNSLKNKPLSRKTYLVLEVILNFWDLYIYLDSRDAVL